MRKHLILGAAAAMAAGLGARPVVRMTDEEREAARAKLDAQRQADDATRREHQRMEALRAAGIPAWMNRRTGKPHEHNRQKARHLRSLSTPEQGGVRI